MGEVLCLPCKACGFGKDLLCDVMSSPFFPYIGMTIALNAAPAIMGMKTFADLGGGTCSEAIQWLIVNGFLCLLHIVASFYIVHKIMADRKNHNLDSATQDLANADHLEAQNMRDVSEHSSWARIKHVLCYDCGVALYIIMIVVWMCWMATGVTRYLNVDQGTCSDIASRLLTSMICGYFFMSLGAFAFMCSLCCLQPWN